MSTVLAPLKDLTASIESTSLKNPSLERWVYSSKELQREVLQRILMLCFLYDQLPKTLLREYVDTLVDVLRDKKVLKEVNNTKQISKKLLELSNYLRKHGDHANADAISRAIQ